MKRTAQSVRVPAAVPGIVLRLLVVVLVAAGAATAAPYPLWRYAALILAAVSVVVPRSMTAWLAAAVLPIGMLANEPSPGRTAAVLLLVHGIHVLASLSLTVPAHSRLAVRALLPTLMRFAVIQAVAQPIAFGAVGLAGGTGWHAPWAAVAGAALLLAGAAVGVVALRRAASPASRRVR